MDIFSSADVYEPPAGDMSSAIYRDVRGEIHRIEAGGFKVNLLFTKRGFMRSGDLHKNIQFDFIYSGKVEIWTREGNRDVKKVYGKNQFIELPPGIPHLCKLWEDCVMAEWWDGPFKAWYYKPYRAIIDEQFKSMTGK